MVNFGGCGMGIGGGLLCGRLLGCGVNSASHVGGLRRYWCFARYLLRVNGASLINNARRAKNAQSA